MPRQMRPCKRQCSPEQQVPFLHGLSEPSPKRLRFSFVCCATCMISSLKRAITGSLLSFLVCLLAHLDIMLKNSSTLCTFLALCLQEPDVQGICELLGFTGRHDLL